MADLGAFIKPFLDNLILFLGGRWSDGEGAPLSNRFDAMVAIDCGIHVM